MSNPHPSSEIHSVGLREGQLLANGATPEEAAEISAAYHLGKPMPETDNEVVNRVSVSLTQVSGYGQYSDQGGE